jgi:pimeloyl-ACP methyl ester carboxylesterase
MPDTRGTGESADASDPLSYRCDRLAGDVEALRAHIGLDRMDLLGHSAAGDLATLYAAAFPQRVAHLILLTPGLDAVGVEETDEQWRAALARRSAEPWYPAALAAMEKAETEDESMENRRTYMPFFYGRWDSAAQAHVDGGVSERSRPVRDGFRAEGAFNPSKTREAVSRRPAPGPAPAPRRTARDRQRSHPAARRSTTPGGRLTSHDSRSCPETSVENSRQTSKSSDTSSARKTRCTKHQPRMSRSRSTWTGTSTSA